MKKIVVYVSLILMLLYVGCAKKTPQDRLAEAEKALAKGDVLSAVIMLEDVIKKHANEPVADDARLMLARANYLSGDLETSRQLLTTIFQKYGPNDPKGSSALNVILGIYAQEKKFDDGIKLVNQTLADKNTTGTLVWQLEFALSDFYQLKEDQPKAIAQLKKIIDTVPDESVSISALENLVSIYEKNKDYLTAAKLYEDFLNNHPDTKMKNIIIGGMAYYYEKQGDKAQAEKLYAQAVSGFESDIAAAVSSEEKVTHLVELAKLHSLRSADQKALEIYDRILKEFPNERQLPAIMMEMARIYTVRKQYDRALSLLNQVAQRWPKTPVADAAFRMMQQINQERAKPQGREQGTTGTLTAERPTTAPSANK